MISNLACPTHRKHGTHTSPYALTEITFKPMTTNKKIRLIAHPGKLSDQYCKSSWRAIRSEAVDTASLNQ
jgi:hypothetical protein